MGPEALQPSPAMRLLQMFCRCIITSRRVECRHCW